jgi:hypothetical protein
VKLRELDDNAERQLASLDQRFVVAAAPKVARAVDELGRAVRRTREAAAGLAREVDLRDLNALDVKYATRGPLAFFREVPQLLAVITGIVFIVGTLTAAHELQSRQTSTDQTVQPPTDGASTPGSQQVLALGPTIGKPASTYLTYAATSLTEAATGAPDDQRLAMVSLSAYYRPAQASSILSGYVVKRAWVRVTSAGRAAASIPVEVSGDLGRQLTTFYARTAQGQGEAAAQYQKLADTTDEAQYKTFYEQFAKLSRAQAKAFGHDCACAYAFVVSATPTQLLSLRSRPGIRSIEVAGRGARLSDLDISTLLPEVKGIVPNPAALADPPS